jgi:hypothetical protein
MASLREPRSRGERIAAALGYALGTVILWVIYAALALGALWVIGRVVGAGFRAGLGG